MYLCIDGDIPVVTLENIRGMFIFVSSFVVVVVDYEHPSFHLLKTNS